MNFSYLKCVLKKITAAAFSFTRQNIIYKSILTAVYMLAGIKFYVISLMTLTLLDVATGVIASIKKGEDFKSKVLKKGLVDKALLYIIMLISVLVLELLVKSVYNYQAYYLTFFVTFVIATYETISVSENLLVINPDLIFLRSIVRIIQNAQTKTIEKAEKGIDVFIDNVDITNVNVDKKV